MLVTELIRRGALALEARTGAEPLRCNARDAAARFVGGLGRSRDFDTI